MRHGGALEPGVRSVGRSGFASEVRPCLSCCTERAYEVTSSPGIWKQRRLPVPPAAPMDHAPWCGGRVAPSPGTRAAIVAFGVSVRPIWAKTDLAEFCSKRNQARKNKRVPLMRFHIGFVVSKIPQHNELSQLPQSPSMSVGGGRTRLGMGLNRAVLLEASLWLLMIMAFTILAITIR